MEHWCHQADDSLAGAQAKAFYSEATALVKTLIISHHLFFFSDVLPRQNSLSLWDIVSDKETERVKDSS